MIRKYSPSIRRDNTIVSSNSNMMWLVLKKICTSESLSPFKILLISPKVLPGTMTFISLYCSFNATLRIDMRCPSRETSLSSLPVTSISSPVIILLLSFGEIEKIVWRMISFKVNWESVMNLSRSMWGI